MNGREGRARIDPPRRALRRQLTGIAAFFGLLAGASASAQTPADPAPQYCYRGTQTVCRDTLEKAEQAMRAAPENSRIANLLEQAETRVFPTSETAEYVFRVKEQPGTLHPPSYIVANGAGGSLIGGGHGCTRGTDPNLSSWCAAEDDVVARAMATYRALHPTCSFSNATQVADLRIDPYRAVTSNQSNALLNHGIVEYGRRQYATQFTCASGSSGTYLFDIRKEASFTCPSSYRRLGDLVANDGIGDLTLPVLCQYIPGPAVITGPIQQCASCPASEYPVHPATGEKTRTEPDFAFAGHTFTRYYRSLRQFRNNVGFGIGWSHTFSDRVFGVNGTQAAGVVDDAGSYEGFVPIGANRLRSVNDSDRVLEYVTTTGSVRWRLREADGEVREFDANRQLVAIRDIDDPRLDVVLGYRNGLLASATDGQGRVLRFEYNGAKLMTRVVLPDGNAYLYRYDPDRNLIATEGPDGRVRQYHYAEAGLTGDASQRNHLTGITAETGRRYAAFRYDARGRVVESRAYGTPHNVTTVAYDSGTQATVTTAANEQRVYNFEPGLYRRITGVATVGETAQDRQIFDSAGRLLRSTDRRGVHTDYEYDASGAYRSATIEAVGTPEQRRLEIVRDPVTHRITEQRVRDAAGVLVAQTQWQYNARGQVAAEIETDPTTSATRRTSYTYCEQTDVAAGVCPQPGLLIAVDGARDNASDIADISRFEYRMADASGCVDGPATCQWRRGDLLRAIDAKGQFIDVLAHDGTGRMRSWRDVAGVRTDLTYDSRGRVLSQAVRGSDDTSETDDRIERFEYRADGELERAIAPDGVFVTYTYDDIGRLLSITDRDGHRQVFTLDGDGNAIQEDVRDANGVLLQTLSRSFDVHGRLTAVRDAAQRPERVEYDAVGLPIKTIDRLQRETRDSLDPLGRLVRRTQNATASAEAQDRAESQYRYDALDRIVRVTDPKGLHTEYRHNAFGDLLELRSPDSGNTGYDYDPAGNRIGQLDANGKLTAYRYDALNRLRMVDYAAAVPDEAFAWDVAMGDCPAGEQFAAGRLSRIMDASGSTAYCWNRFGDLTRMVQRTGGRTFTVRWVYQADGRLQRMLYPGGVEVDYRYDAQGRIAEIGVNSGNGRQVLLTGATYHPFGEASGWTYGNGLALRRTIDADGLPVAVEDGPLNGASVGLALGYTFDATGNLQALRSGRANAPGTRTQTYTHDGLDRLTAVRDGALLLDEYRYDRTGNRTLVGEWTTVGSIGGLPGMPGTPVYDFLTWAYGYPADSHRLQQAGAEPRQHDAAGNLTQWGDTAAPGGPRGVLAYNEGNRLATFSRLGGVLASYAYNAHGQRVRKTVAGGLDIFTVYAPNGRWLGDFNASGGAEQLAIWLDDLPVGLITGNGSQARLQYIEADALGTPRAVIDPQRNVAVWRWDALGEAFGRDYPQTDPDGDGAHFNLDMRFPGQRFDAETGFHYNYFRDYDPTTGRYIQSDPIGLAGGMSTYGYANGAPGVYSDPEGLVAGHVGRAVLGAVAPRLSARAITTRLGARSMLDPALRAAYKEAALKRALKRQAARLARGGGKSESPACDSAIRTVTISRSRYPEAAKHIDDAIASGKSRELKIDRPNARANRRESLRGFERRRGFDRDEFPPAMFEEGGRGASVRYISPSDNRGAGASIAAQLRGLPNGTRVRIEVID